MMAMNIAPRLLTSDPVATEQEMEYDS